MIKKKNQTKQPQARVLLKYILQALSLSGEKIKINKCDMILTIFCLSRHSPTTAPPLPGNLAAVPYVLPISTMCKFACPKTPSP